MSLTASGDQTLAGVNRHRLRVSNANLGAIDPIATWKPSFVPNLTLQAEYLYASQSGAGDQRSQRFVAGCGRLHRVRFQRRRLRSATRAEFFDDMDGARTDGEAQTLWEITQTISYKIPEVTGLIARLEYRHDNSSQNSFTNNNFVDPVTGQQHLWHGQDTLAANFILRLLTGEELEHQIAQRCAKAAGPNKRTRRFSFVGMLPNRKRLHAIHGLRAKLLACMNAVSRADGLLQSIHPAARDRVRDAGAEEFRAVSADGPPARARSKCSRSASARASTSHRTPPVSKPCVESIPSSELLAKASQRVANVKFPVRLLEASSEKLPLEDRQLRYVVMTFTLCSIPDVGAALHEIRRVLKPGRRAAVRRARARARCGRDALAGSDDAVLETGRRRLPS